MWRIFGFAGVCVISGIAGATDLNAPVTNRPTIASEIAGGAAAGFNCVVDNITLGNGTLSPLRAGQCVSNVDAQNRQRLTQYEPFGLGLHFEAWLLADRSSSPERPAANGVEAAMNAGWHRAAAALFVVYRDYQAKLGLTDDQLITAVKASPQTKARIAYWLTQPKPF